ncbi:hypothetical protein HK105_207728 [Polyrhizophydium stewartii]|uniref:Transcription factor domain-containing protein n=1 Tax=Polyrhizophydium stewartii TaxID=2732419 RepID=A0ABR4MZX2_9FUNG
MVRRITACESCVRKADLHRLRALEDQAPLLAPVAQTQAVQAPADAAGTSDLLARIAHLEASIAQMASAAAQPQPTQPPLPTHHGSHGAHASPPSLAPLPSLPQFVVDAKPSVWTPEERALIDSYRLLDPVLQFLIPHGIFVSRDFLLECIAESRVLELSLKSIGTHQFQALGNNDSSYSVGKRLYNDALVETNKAILNPSVANIIAFHSMFFSSFLNENEPVMRPSVDISRRMAIDLGLNDEQKLRAMPISESQRNNYRCAWYTLCQIDWLFSCSIGHDIMILPDMHKARYPFDMPLKPCDIQQLSDTKRIVDRSLDLELLSNSADGFFIPPVPGRGVLANLLAIERIMAAVASGMRVALTSTRSLIPFDESIQQDEFDRRFWMLEASLDGWLKHIPDEVRFFEQRARAILAARRSVKADDHSAQGSSATEARECIGGTGLGGAASWLSRDCDMTDPVSWRPLVVLGTYFTARMLLHRRELLRMLAESPHLVSVSRAFNESLQCALDFVDLLQIVIDFEAYRNLGPPFRLFISNLGVFLMAAKYTQGVSDTDKARILKGIEILKELLEQTNKAWIGSLVIIDLFMLEHLDTVEDPAEIFKQARKIQMRPPSLLTTDEQMETTGFVAESAVYQSGHESGLLVGALGVIESIHFRSGALGIKGFEGSLNWPAHKQNVMDAMLRSASTSDSPLCESRSTMCGMPVHNVDSISPSMHPPAMSLSGSHSSAASHAHHAHNASHHAREHQGLHQGPHHVGMSVLLAASADAAADLGDRGGEAGGTAFTGQSGYRGYPGLAASDE